MVYPGKSIERAKCHCLTCCICLLSLSGLNLQSVHGAEFALYQDSNYTTIQIKSVPSPAVVVLRETINSRLKDYKVEEARAEFRHLQSQLDASQLSAYDQEMLLRTAAEIAYTGDEIEHSEAQEQALLLLNRESLSQENYHWAVRFMAQTYMDLFEYRTASEWFVSLLQDSHEPEYTDLILAANALSKIPDYRQAESYLQLALRLHPDETLAYPMLAHVFINSGRYQDFLRLKLQVTERFAHSDNPAHQNLLKSIKKMRYIH